MTSKDPGTAGLIRLTGRAEETAVVDAMRSHGYAVEALGPAVYHDLYLDTFDWLLLEKGLSLCYRVTDGKALYALKGVGAAEGGAPRPEVEAALDGPLKDPTEVKARRIKDVIGGKIYPRRLLGQVQVRTERRRYSAAAPDGAGLEVAFEASSFVLKGLDKTRRSGPVHGLEARLVSGGPGSLDALASFLAASFDYAPSRASKFETAVERFKIAPRPGRPPEKYAIRAQDRLDLALKKFISWQIKRLREEIPGLNQDIDTEFVHKARVATRRMRSALRLLQGAVAAPAGEFIDGELKWLAGLLGEVRDLDVFLLNLERFRKDIGRFPGKQKRFLANWIREERRAPLEALIEALGSKRYRDFEQRLNRYLGAPLPRRPARPLAGKTAREAAPALVSACLDAVVEQGRSALAGRRLKEFHALRIRMKRLRYACELMSGAYGGALDPFIERMAGMQDCLGVIQDTIFMRGFIDGIFKEGRRKMAGPPLMFVLGEIYQFYTGLAEERIREFDGIWGQFASHESISRFKESLGA